MSNIRRSSNLIVDFMRIPGVHARVFLALFALVVCFAPIAGAQSVKRTRYVYDAKTHGPAPLIVEVFSRDLKRTSYKKYLNGSMDAPETKYAIYFYVAAGHSVPEKRLRKLWPAYRRPKNKKEVNAKVKEFRNSRFGKLLSKLDDVYYQRRWDIDGLTFLDIVMVVPLTPADNPHAIKNWPTTLMLDRTAHGWKVMQAKKEPDWWTLAENIVSFTEDRKPVKVAVPKRMTEIVLPPKKDATDGPRWRIWLNGDFHGQWIAAKYHAKGDLARLVKKVIQTYRSKNWNDFLNLWTGPDKAHLQKELQEFVNDPDRGGRKLSIKITMSGYDNPVRLVYTIDFGSYAAALIERKAGTGVGRLQWLRFLKNAHGQWKLTDRIRMGGDSYSFPMDVYDVIKTDYVKRALFSAANLGKGSGKKSAGKSGGVQNR